MHVPRPRFDFIGHSSEFCATSGLRKAKRYDWKDTNLSLFGSDTEKQVKKESADAERAWQGQGQQVGLKIWRIVKFKVTDWPTEDYGKFYSGDSYIILNTYNPSPDSEELAYDVHFWIGTKSTQDEYGTAAYKTVELDTFLNDSPIQHREVQDFEGALFKSYFDTIQVMSGGADTGFRHVLPEEYIPRLLHFQGERKSVVVREVPLSRSKLTSNDVFILDLGLKLYQWNGKNCNKDEKFKAMQYLIKIKSERNATCETLDEADISTNHVFYESLTVDEDEEFDEIDESPIQELYKVSDEDGSMDMEKIKTSDVNSDDFESKDVFVLDIGTECFVWIGSNASPNEKKNGIGYAHSHLVKTTHPFSPITVIGEGRRNAAFEIAIGA